MNIKDFLNTSANISQIVSTPGFYEKVKDTEQKTQGESREQKTLANAQSRRIIAFLLILVGVGFIYLNIKSYSFIGLIFGALLVLLGVLYANRLQKTIRTFQGQVVYDKAPLSYRFISIGLLVFAFLPLYLINKVSHNTELGMGG